MLRGPRFAETHPAEEAPPAPLPVDQETVDKNRNARLPYFEAREASMLEQKELAAVHESIGKEVREMCRPEIDEYVDCCVGRMFSFIMCKRQAIVMRRCISKIETPEYIDRRVKELLKEREKSGQSLINNRGAGTTRERRAMYNKAIAPETEDPLELMLKKPKLDLARRYRPRPKEGEDTPP
mmetsp:Transcript_21329/g.63650  ORF Transcript_21329/g.63650 Transcript_21329/m.63650 type:complete len:182 (-) Transcript_21329:40-585(-)